MKTLNIEPPTPRQGAKTTSKKHKYYRYITIAVVCAAIIAGLALWEIEISRNSKPIKSATVTRGDIDICVSAPVKVSLPSRTHLNFKTPGKITEIYVRKGNRVVAGQILAKLDMATINPQVRQAEAGLDIAKAGLDKLRAGRSRGEIEVAEAAVDQAAASVENAKRNLDTVKKLIGQSKQKADLSLQNSTEDYNIACQQLNKLLKGASQQQIDLAASQRNQALQTVEDAEDSHKKVRELNGKTLEEANQSVDSAHQSYIHAKNVYESIPSTDTAAYNAAKASYLQAKAVYNGAQASRERVIAANNQALQAAQAQVNSAKKTHEVSSAQYALTVAPVNNEELAVAQSRVKQAEISLEMAKIDTDSASLDTQLEAAQSQLSTAVKSSQVAVTQLELQKEGPRIADILSIQGQIEQAKAALDSAQATAEDMVLKAPFSGKVVSINGKVGEIAGVNSMAGAGQSAASSAPGTPSAFITLVNLGQVEVVADVDETEVGKLNMGQKVRIMLDTYENVLFDGKLTDISLESSKNSTGGTVFTATISINPYRYELREGMGGDADIVVSGKKNVLTIPYDAIKTKDDTDTAVYMIKDGITRLRKIRLGLASDCACEVISGLREGEVVAIGKASITDGQRVKVEKLTRLNEGRR